MSHSFERIIVSTDSEEIAAVARDCGAEVPFLRPAELATDTAPTEPALIHALDWLLKNEGYEPRLVTLLQPTCPVRKRGSINRALQLLSDQQANSLLSVREIHPFLWRNQAAPASLYDFRRRPRRQDVPEADRLYEETGSIYVMESQTLRQTGNRLGGRIALFPMDPEESWDVDAEADLNIAEALLQRLVDDDH